MSEKTHLCGEAYGQNVQEQYERNAPFPQHYEAVTPTETIEQVAGKMQEKMLVMSWERSDIVFSI